MPGNGGRIWRETSFQEIAFPKVLDVVVRDSAGRVRRVVEKPIVRLEHRGLSGT